MTLPSWWIEPRITEGHLVAFALVLAGLTALTTLCSPGRRKRLGTLKFAAAHAVLIAAPLAGVLVIRSGYRHAYLDAGAGFWSAMWLSLAWMLAFIFTASLIVRAVPPTSWLLRDLRRAGRDVWTGRLRRLVGMRS